MVEWALGGTTTTSAQGAFSFVAVAGTSVLAVSAENHKTRLQSGIAMVSGETVTKAVELVPETFDALPVPDTQSTQKIVTPADKADHLHQPFAAVVKNETLTASTCFAPYQEPVNIYLGITSDHPDLVPYFFLLNTGDQVTVLDETLFPWRDLTDQWNETELFSIPVEAMPKGIYTFYLLVTDKPDTLNRYDFRFFTLKIE